MRWHGIRLVAADHARRAPGDDQPTRTTFGRTPRTIPPSDAMDSDLAIQAARIVVERAIEDPATVAAIYHATATPTSGRNLAATMAADLLPARDDRSLVTMIDDRTGAISAIATAARTLTSPTGGCPTTALVTAGDAPHHDHHTDDDGPTAGAALVLSRTEGALRLVSTIMRDDPYLRALHREGAHPDLIHRRATEVTDDVIATVLREASPQADITAAHIACMIAPASPDAIETKTFIERLGGRSKALKSISTHQLPATNLGTADLLVRLGPIDDARSHLDNGEWVLLVATGDSSAAAALLRVA